VNRDVQCRKIDIMSKTDFSLNGTAVDFYTRLVLGALSRLFDSTYIPSKIFAFAKFIFMNSYKLLVYSI